MEGTSQFVTGGTAILAIRYPKYYATCQQTFLLFVSTYNRNIYLAVAIFIWKLPRLLNLNFENFLNKPCFLKRLSRNALLSEISGLSVSTFWHSIK